MTLLVSIVFQYMFVCDVKDITYLMFDRGDGKDITYLMFDRGQGVSV